VMLSEIAFAAVSSAWLGAEPLTARIAGGGALIIVASAWATWAARPSGSA
jgi:hypothetical protein